MARSLWLTVALASRATHATLNAEQAQVHAPKVSVRAAVSAFETPRRQVLQIDDTKSDPGFAAFAKDLLRAAEVGDLTFLRNAMASDVKLDFDRSSPDDIIRTYELTSGTPWRGLRDALRLGCRRFRSDTGVEFVAPYIMAFDSDRFEIDSTALVITGARVRVRDRPSLSGRIVATLSYDVVAPGPQVGGRPLVFESEDAPTGSSAWVDIVTPEGESGFVYGRYVWNASGLRFYFEKVHGQWKIAAVTIGD